jgi:hypothetical protein
MSRRHPRGTASVIGKSHCRASNHEKLGADASVPELIVEGGQSPADTLTVENHHA